MRFVSRKHLWVLGVAAAVAALVDGGHRGRFEHQARRQRERVGDGRVER